MGVPKFFRWISERYPCLSQLISEHEVPDFDNLYLDMNGIIHTCSHPDDDNPHFRISEEKIMRDIFHYICYLFRLIRPRKVFFMAIDGVAPRAKMNQQRARRFRAAKEAETKIKEALGRGEVLPTEKRFDSNCITPGTAFMERLCRVLKYFVVERCSNDPLWQGVRVYLSGPACPGEGEHKIMDFIRAERARSDYDPNTRHCLYGLDADLIMLGLCSHELNFCLLREEVKFGGRKTGPQKTAQRANAPEDIKFYLLHHSLLRDYIDHEFASLKNRLPFGYNLERIIDDFVFLGFLVGNDFIPHLPQLHINQDALPIIWQTYRRVLPTLDDYLHNAGKLNKNGFDKFLQSLCKWEMDQFEEQYELQLWFRSKRSKPPPAKPVDVTNGNGGGDDNDEDEPGRQLVSFYADDGGGADELGGEDDEEEDEQENSRLYDRLFDQHKAAYYQEKMAIDSINDRSKVRAVAIEYVRGMQWILYYYYHGCSSWSWYYPYHYTPYISDITNIAEMDLEFDLGEPFRPFEQLMAVLPAFSAELLPEPLQVLMTDKSSSIIDFYPMEFREDLNGKQQPWEAVVLIPFINERRLLDAVQMACKKVRPGELARNKHGPHLLCTSDLSVPSTGSMSAPETYLPTLTVTHCRTETVPMWQFRIDVSQIRWGLLPNSTSLPQTPTLHRLPHTTEKRENAVRVFQSASRGESCIVKLSIDELPILKDHNFDSNSETSCVEFARKIIGRVIYVSYPHLRQALVCGVQFPGGGFELSLKRPTVQGLSAGPPRHALNLVPGQLVDLDCLEQNALDEDDVLERFETLSQTYQERWGVDVGKMDIILLTGQFQGYRQMEVNGRMMKTAEFSPRDTRQMLQTCMFEETTCMKAISKGISDLSGIVTRPSVKIDLPLTELFPIDSTVFLMERHTPFYGAVGRVAGIRGENVLCLFEPRMGLVQFDREILKLKTEYWNGCGLASFGFNGS